MSQELSLPPFVRSAPCSLGSCPPAPDFSRFGCFFPLTHSVEQSLHPHLLAPQRPSFRPLPLSSPLFCRSVMRTATFVTKVKHRTKRKASSSVFRCSSRRGSPLLPSPSLAFPQITPTSSSFNPSSQGYLSSQLFFIFPLFYFLFPTLGEPEFIPQRPGREHEHDLTTLLPSLSDEGRKTKNI